MPYTNNLDLPTGDTLTLQERKDTAEFWKGFYEDTSDELNISFKYQADGSSEWKYWQWIGTGGATAYWADWRSNHSSVTAESEDGHEVAFYEAWQDFENENFTVEGVAKTKAEMITKWTNEITQCDTLIAAESESSEPSE
jgi:hypothetical protein